MLRYLFIFLFLSTPLYAQTVEQDGAVDSYSLATARAEHIFIADQGAIEAEKNCHNRSFSPADLQSMDQKIAAEMTAASPTIALGAARLINLRRQAEDDMDSKISSEGCDGHAATAAGAIFTGKLEAASN